MSDIRVEQAARLASEWSRLGSFEFVVSEEKTLLPSWVAKGGGFKAIDFHYIETPAGQRYFDMSAKGEAGEIRNHTTSYSDGRRFSVVQYQKGDPTIARTISIGQSFDNEATRGASARPDPLRYYFIGKTPLHEALPSSTYLGADQFLGKTSHVFLFRDVRWGQIRQDTVIHLAEDGILPHRVLSYKDEAARLAERPLWTWSATALESIQGRPVPIKSHQANYDSTDPKRETSSKELTIRKVEFGKAFPASTFWRDADASMTVIDFPHGKITPPSVRPAEAKTVVSDPIRVPEAADDSTILARGSIGLGAAVLVAGLVLWIRRA